MTSQVIAARTTSSNPTISNWKRALARFVATERDISALILRATLAIVMFPHGAQKMLGWFGGYGFEGTLGFLTKQIGMPAPAAVGVIALEFFGPWLLLAGLGTRFLAVGFVGLMIGAIATVHAPHGFFMNWTGARGGEGFEYHLLVIAMSLALVVRGGGALSLDRRLFSNLGSRGV